MKTFQAFIKTLIIILILTGGTVSGQGKHLFILSGQSNMGGLHPEESFIPTVEKEFGEENVIVVKDALGGQPIRRWYKAWKGIEGDAVLPIGDLYDRLMEKVNAAIENQKLKTVTFIWMQGERDARESHGEVYKESLLGLYKQLSKDMNRSDINFVNGRLSDFDMSNAKYPHWTKIRDIQVEVAQSNPRFAWINTDDLNDGVNRNGKDIKNDLHMSAKGYVIMGERFANAAIELIKKNENNIEKTKALNIDFNWGMGGPNRFAGPGVYAHADPKAHVDWYKFMGANTIQTFCVSCNGYAWYKGGSVPEQPGLKTDFLREEVKYGHEAGMKVLGYFCIAANTRWGIEHPGESYRHMAGYHIPLTDKYLAYLKTVISEGVKTGIDGFMIDWVWPPNQKSTKGKWIECEKQLYEQLMDEPFPGEDKLTKEKKNEYGKRSVERCWRVIHDTAKEINPDCIIWLSCNNLLSPYVPEAMLKECDWIMNETPDAERVEKTKSKVGEHTKLMQVVTNGMGNNYNAKELFEKLETLDVDFYGFTRPNPVTTFPHFAVEADGSYTELTRNMLTIREKFRGEPNDKDEIINKLTVMLHGRQAKLNGTEIKTGDNIWSRIEGMKTGESVVWEFGVPQKGKYDIWVHYALEFPESSLQIETCGKSFYQVVTATGGRDDVHPVKVGSVDIENLKGIKLVLKAVGGWNPTSFHFVELIPAKN